MLVGGGFRSHQLGPIYFHVPTARCHLQRSSRDLFIYTKFKMIHPLLASLTILLLFDHAKAGDVNIYPCNDKYDRIQGNRGFLSITRNISTCGFRTQDDNHFLALRLDNLKLKAGDKLEIKPDRPTDNTKSIYQPPFQPGYLVSGIEEPTLTFTFNGTDGTTMLVEFVQDLTSLPISADNSNDLNIQLLGLNDVKLEVYKTIQDTIHLQLEGAKMSDNSLGHALISTPNVLLPIASEQGQSFRLRTSTVLSNCSGTFTDSKEDTHEITGPDARLLNQTYKCVNLFKTTLGEQAHYEASFDNFLGMVDLDDQLILEDGTGSDTSLSIIKSKSGDYLGRSYNFRGQNLAVIYESPRVVSPSQVQFKLSIRAKASGGIINKQGALVFPKGGRVRYILQPDSQQYAAIEISNQLKLQDANLTISSENTPAATFAENTLLPPIVMLKDPNLPMVLDFDGKSFSKLAGSIKFKSLVSGCHSLTSSDHGHFSVTTGNSTCYWTIASNKKVNLMINNNDLGPLGCLTIQALSGGKPLYSKCNLGSSEILPIFTLSQCYVNVSLSQSGKNFDATLFPASEAVQSDLGDRKEISSPGYPQSYAWSSETETIALNATGKNYLLTFADVDIRAGEKFLIGNQELDIIKGDYPLSNISTSLTIKRSADTNDYSFHRGFKVLIRNFDRILMADMSKKRFVSGPNVTSLFVKLSSPGPTATEFGKFISFNISFASPPQNFSLLTYDDRSMKGHLITSTNYSGSTTSDTLLIVYTPEKPNSILPEMIVDYSTKSCVTADHICDNFTRCVPQAKLCKGISYCEDGSDLRVVCSDGPAPAPRIVETGVSGVTVFILSVLMLTLGAVSAIFGPDLFKLLENRFRSGQYTTFTSTE